MIKRRGDALRAVIRQPSQGHFGHILGLFWEQFMIFLDIFFENLKVFLVVRDRCLAFLLSLLFFHDFLVPLDLQNHGFRVEGIANPLKSWFLFREMLREQIVMIFLNF